MNSFNDDHLIFIELNFFTKSAFACFKVIFGKSDYFTLQEVILNLHST